MLTTSKNNANPTKKINPNSPAKREKRDGKAVSAGSGKLRPETQGGEAAPLGTTTKSASPSNSTGTGANPHEYRACAASQGRRNERYSLRKVAAGILPKHRVTKCMCYLRGDGAQVFLGRTASFGQVTVCGAAWVCPICEAKVMEKRRKEISKVFEAVSREHGYRKKAVMVTLTLPHGRGDCLTLLLDWLLGAFRDLFAAKFGKAFRERSGMIGLIKSLEVMWGKRNGWHPHLHVILFVDGDYSAKTLKAELSKAWIGQLRRAGLVIDEATEADMLKHAIDVHDHAQCGDYLAKTGNSNAWGADAELTKNSRKVSKNLNPFGLLTLAGEGDKQASALFAEYAAAVHGKARIFISQTLRKLANLKAKSDEDLANEKEEGSVYLGMIPKSYWYSRIVKHGRQCEVLSAAEVGGVEALEALKVGFVPAEKAPIPPKPKTQKWIMNDIRKRRAIEATITAIMG